LTYTEKEAMDPTTIKGSYAGAMGISQFMPSNIAPYGKDGNADGRIDLFVHADAICQCRRLPETLWLEAGDLPGKGLQGGLPLQPQQVLREHHPRRCG
jgi:hypothetical protein